MPATATVPVPGTRSTPIPGLSQRPAGAADRDFLKALFVACRRQQFQLAGLDGDTLDVLIQQQFAARERDYSRSHPTATTRIIVRDGAPVGAMILDRRGTEVNLVDIAILPPLQAEGVGTAVIEEVITEAADVGLPVRLFVRTDNPAVRLYRRLGFQAFADRGADLAMERRP